jgi:hypothetical protein
MVKLAAVLLQVARVAVAAVDLKLLRHRAALVVLGLATKAAVALVEQVVQLELRELRVLHSLLAVAVAAMVQPEVVVLAVLAVRLPEVVEVDPLAQALHQVQVALAATVMPESTLGKELI